MGNRRNCELPPILNTCISKTTEGNIFFRKFAIGKIYHYGVKKKTDESKIKDFAIRFASFYGKKGKSISVTVIIKFLLIIIFNRSI